MRYVLVNALREARAATSKREEEARAAISKREEPWIKRKDKANMQARWDNVIVGFGVFAGIGMAVQMVQRALQDISSSCLVDDFSTAFAGHIDFFNQNTLDRVC